MMKKTIFISCAALILSGCAISEQACQSGDWYRVGVNDGKQGRSEERFTAIDRQCQRHGIQASQELWEAGRQEGLKSYCTSKNAFALGLEGREMRSTCPPELRAMLDHANERGLEIFSIKTLLDELRIEQGELQAMLETLDPGSPEYQDTKRKLRSVEFDIWKYENKLNRLLRQYGIS